MFHFSGLCANLDSGDDEERKLWNEVRVNYMQVIHATAGNTEQKKPTTSIDTVLKKVI